MKCDLRQTAYYRETTEIYRIARRLGERVISDAKEVSTDGSQVPSPGALVSELAGAFPTRICLTNLPNCDTRIIALGPNTDRLPKYSPQGRMIGFSRIWQSLRTSCSVRSTCQSGSYDFEPGAIVALDLAS